MKVLVLGATGGSGRAAVEQLLSAGHEVTAFTRRAEPTENARERLHTFVGDVMNPEDVERAVKGQDAVIITLGIRENPLRVRFFGAAHTPMDVRSAGTRNVVSAMRQHGVRKLVVQTSYGVGVTRHRLGTVDALFFKLLLKPQIADTEKQEEVVRESGLDWVIAQPVHLTDAAEQPMPALSTEGDTELMKVSRNSVGRFLAHAAQSAAFIGRSVAVSGAAA
ncbi:SDR family NAD(P)-dependent oxidoreductase [Myxococcaceae bacterium JPH2]|nr:SDR family NAD(P)-dependent oxidoreductase [Myxococcaceae bacterium JPH2]